MLQPHLLPLVFPNVCNVLPRMFPSKLILSTTRYLNEHASKSNHEVKFICSLPPTLKGPALCRPLPSANSFADRRADQLNVQPVCSVRAEFLKHLTVLLPVNLASLCVSLLPQELPVPV